jgi:hypothetical protein
MGVEMNGPSLPQEQFETALNRLVESVVLGRASVEIGRGLSARVLEDPVIAHVSPTFWGTTISAHLDVAQLIAFKLFDKQSNALSIAYLLEQAVGNAAAFSNATPSQVTAIISTARTQVSNLESHLMPIREKRNRIIAHADSTIVRDPEKLAKVTQVTFSDLNAIFGTAGDILNEISVAYRDSSPSWPLIGGDD